MDRKIKVCHLTSVHPVYDIRIFKKECTSLAKAGYDVHFVVPNVESHIENGVQIEGVQVNYRGRIQRILKVTRMVFQKALEVDADIYHVHDPELLHWAVKLSNKGKIVIYDAHEDIVAQILLKGWIPFFLRKTISQVMNMYLKRCIRKISAVITVTPIIVDKYKKMTDTVVMITNFPILNHELSNNYQTKNICFPGIICKDWLHENIINVINDIDDTKYLLAGPSTIDYLNKLKLLSGWNKVDFRGKIPHSEVRDMMNESLIGIALHDYTPNCGYKKGTLGVIKLFEYMEAGLPVICTDFEIWEQIISEEKCGICVNPHDLNAIKEAVNYLLTNPDVAQTMGENGRKAVERKYNWKIEERKLLNLYESLLGHD